jgi:rhodanese-related sulfurtransferase
MSASITPVALKDQLDRDDPKVILDVRRKADYESSPKKIATALWRDPERVNDWDQDLSRDRPIIVYCAKGGSVSQSIANRLQEKGLQVQYLEGGIKAWIENGEPVE